MVSPFGLHMRYVGISILHFVFNAFAVMLKEVVFQNDRYAHKNTCVDSSTVKYLVDIGAATR